MERKRLVNQANIANGFRWHGVCGLREHEGRANARLAGGQVAVRLGYGMTASLAVLMASCANYESDYEQSVQNYLSGQPKVSQPAANGGGAATQSASPSGGGSDQPISYGSGSAAGSSGSGSAGDFQTIGSGASGVILPGQ